MHTIGRSNFYGVSRILGMLRVFRVGWFGFSLVRRILLESTGIVGSWRGNFIGMELKWLGEVASVVILLLKPYIGSLGVQLIRLMGVFRTPKGRKALSSLELLGFELQLLVSHSPTYLCHFFVPL